MKHPHAELMLEYAKDAMETDKPWERWEWRRSDGDEWRSSAVCVPTWSTNFQYRRKPKPYEPTLLDQALELEIEAAEKKFAHHGFGTYWGVINQTLARDLRSQRTPAMIEHLKSQGKL